MDPLIFPILDAGRRPAEGTRPGQLQLLDNPEGGGKDTQSPASGPPHTAAPNQARTHGAVALRGGPGVLERGLELARRAGVWSLETNFFSHLFYFPGQYIHSLKGAKIRLGETLFLVFVASKVASRGRYMEHSDSTTS